MADKKVLAGTAIAGLLLGANAKQIIKGITTGLIVIVLSFVLIFYTVNGIEQNSAKLEFLPLLNKDQAKDVRGPVKVFGKFQAQNLKDFTIYQCSTIDCNDTFIFDRQGEVIYPIFTDNSIIHESDLVYVKIELQRYEVIRKVTKDDENSNQETVTYTNQWVTKDRSERWADIKFEGLTINPEKARSVIDFENKTIENIYIHNIESLDTYGQSSKVDEPRFGTTRAIVQYLPNDNREFIVTGEKKGDSITSGEPYIITDQSDAELVKQLAGEESNMRLFLRVVAFFMLTFGITSMLSPILVFTDMIPIAGAAARGLATLIAGIISLIIVLATIFLLNYWWIVAILIFVLLGMLMKTLINRKQPQASAINA